MKKVISTLLLLHEQFMQWGHKRYSPKEKEIERRIAKIIISGVVASLFWMCVSIYAECSYWLFAMCTLHPVYSYYHLVQGGFVWRQPITVYAFLLSCVFYAISFLVQLTKLQGLPSLFP